VKERDRTIFAAHVTPRQPDVRSITPIL